MVFVVPYDGSDLSTAALVRATELGVVLDESTLVVTVVPRGNEQYARERGWIGSGERFDEGVIVARIRDEVADVAPDAAFEHVLVDRYAPPGAIAGEIRAAIRDADASIVFVGSENAGRVVTSVGSVGSAVAADDAYDVHIVRHTGTSLVDGLDVAPPSGDERRSTPDSP